MPDNHTWTVGRLREALAAYPDDLPVTVCVPEEDDCFDEYAVDSGPGYGQVDWGDGRGLRADKTHVQIEAFTLYRPTRPE